MRQIYNNLHTNAYARVYKRDPLTLGLLGGAAISALGSGISSLFSTNAQQRANEQNIAMQRETNDLQYRMMQEQNEWNRQQAIDMFNLEANYNSPLNQMARLKQAGINPAVAFGQNLTTTAGNTNASTPAAVGVPTPQAPRVSPVPSPIAGVSDSISQNILNLAQAIGSVQNAKKTGAETNRINTLLEQELSLLMNQAEGENLANSIKRVQYDMNSLEYSLKVQYGDKERIANIQNLVSQHELNVAKMNTEAAEASLKVIQEKLSSKEYAILKEKAPLLVQELQEQIRLLKKKQQTETAVQSAQYASAENQSAQAGEHRAQTGILEDTRDSIRRIRQAEADRNEDQAEELRRTLNARIVKAIYESNMAEHQKEYWRGQAEKALKSGSYYELEMILDAVPFSKIVR